MDAYVALVSKGNPTLLPMLMGLDLEVIGPDYKNGWTLSGSDATVLAAIEALRAFELVRFVIIL